jgi:hypothetical protein
MRGRITELLPGFLRQAASRRFQYGSFDCFLFPADWFAAVRGIDPGAGIRGRYGDLHEGLALTGARNLPMAFSRLLGAAGMRPTRAPQLGDVAVISLADHIARGAIVSGFGYVLLGDRIGLSRAGFDIARRIASWSIDA